MLSLQDEVELDVAAYVEWFKREFERSPRPGALIVVRKLSGLLIKYEHKGAEDAQRRCPPLALEDFAESVALAEIFSGVNANTLSEFSGLLHEFYMSGYNGEKQ